MGGLKKADFVDGYQNKAIRLLKKFWLLTLFGKSGHKDEDLQKEKSMKLDEILNAVRKTLHNATDLKKLESPSWYAMAFCIKWLWHEDVDNPLKTRIYNEILRSFYRRRALAHHQ
ncbi:hypothetical protein O181_004513 [Austropuccinia psidii MF-1]|uniref:Uncharacterized protein n=1 Tax=Austropuccinia psidii MF-1 TaxID=1389203 RepID=A0A9Q3GEL9_9BASI|nr:hypothetical protein [Austropuccinia psidii MF-1]